MKNNTFCANSLKYKIILHWNQHYHVWHTYLVDIYGKSCTVSKPITTSGTHFMLPWLTACRQQTHLPHHSNTVTTATRSSHQLHLQNMWRIFVEFGVGSNVTSPHGQSKIFLCVKQPCAKIPFSRTISSNNFLSFIEINKFLFLDFGLRNSSIWILTFHCSKNTNLIFLLLIFPFENKNKTRCHRMWQMPYETCGTLAAWLHHNT